MYHPISNKQEKVSTEKKKKTHISSIPRIRLLERARDPHRRRVIAPTAARDLDLRARDVELRDARGPRVVDGQRLDPQQVLAVLDAARDRVRVRARHVPFGFAAGEVGGW